MKQRDELPGSLTFAADALFILTSIGLFFGVFTQLTVLALYLIAIYMLVRGRR